MRQRPVNESDERAPQVSLASLLAQRPGDQGTLTRPHELLDARPEILDNESRALRQVEVELVAESDR